eukprot:tig00000880_g5189.t1
MFSLPWNVYTHTDDMGFFDIQVDNFASSRQSYVPGTAILSTTLEDANGGEVEVLDFAPRFRRFGRVFRPVMIIRQLTPTKGRPRIRVRLRPTFAYGWGTPERTRGSNHIRYLLPTFTLRLTTNAPISYIADETKFVLEDKVFLILMPDESLSESPGEVVSEFLRATQEYWGIFVRGLSIPFEWQAAVIRSAITLRLSAFEETGAIVAAPTTSVADAPGPWGRTFDPRYCFLRDAYFVVTTLNELGVTNMMEGYLAWITNVVAGFGGDADAKKLQPVYGLALETRLHEKEVHRLPGYRGIGPVRVGNKAFSESQHDVYGAVILASTQMFFDERIASANRSRSLFERLEDLGAIASSLYDKADFGPFGASERAVFHTFSAVMCWAGVDRLAKIAARLGLRERAQHWGGIAAGMHPRIVGRAWEERRQTLVSTEEGEVHADLLLLPQLGFLPATDPKFLSTLAEVERRLRKGAFLVKYDRPPATPRPGTPVPAASRPRPRPPAPPGSATPPRGHGGGPRRPTVSATATFWYIAALAEVGRAAEARSLFEALLHSCVNDVGLLSDDLLVPGEGGPAELWGNFPQTVAHVGLINCAATLSRPWKGAF